MSSKSQSQVSRMTVASLRSELSNVGAILKPRMLKDELVSMYMSHPDLGAAGEKRPADQSEQTQAAAGSPQKKARSKTPSRANTSRSKSAAKSRPSSVAANSGTSAATPSEITMRAAVSPVRKAAPAPAPTAEKTTVAKTLDTSPPAKKTQAPKQRTPSSGKKQAAQPAPAATESAPSGAAQQKAEAPSDGSIALAGIVLIVVASVVLGMAGGQLIICQKGSQVANGQCKEIFPDLLSIVRCNDNAYMRTGKCTSCPSGTSCDNWIGIPQCKDGAKAFAPELNRCVKVGDADLIGARKALRYLQTQKGRAMYVDGQQTSFSVSELKKSVEGLSDGAVSTLKQFKSDITAKEGRIEAITGSKDLVFTLWENKVVSVVSFGALVAYLRA